jgi:RNA polymerase sigma-70 factor, ECF subfamily
MTVTSSSSPAAALSDGAPECSDLDGAGRARERAADTLADARAGGELAFTQLIRAHERSVYSLALRALGNASEAEELAQDVFLQLYLDLHRIESTDHLRHWLRRTASHRVIDRLRQRSRRPSEQSLSAEECTTLTAAALPDALAAPAERDPLLARRLSRLIAELPGAPRLVLILRYQEDLDPAEIARVLDISVNTVKSHLKRSLARLRTELGDGDFS